MYRKVWALWAILGCFCLLQALGSTALGLSPAEAVPIQPPAKVAAAADAGQTTLPEARELKLRERIRLGLTIPNMVRKAKELRAAGTLDTENPDIAAAQIAAAIAADNPKAYAEPGIDWEGILAFIERLLPLILQLISIFSAV